jgi:hypothetical protein
MDHGLLIVLVTLKVKKKGNVKMCADDFDCIDDHDSLDAQIDQEEAFFYHVIGEFQDSILKYGADFVVNKLDVEIQFQLKEILNGRS